MKTKKFLVRGLILVFAIGSAVASAFAPELPHVRGKIGINPDVWACVPIDNAYYCSDQGRFECMVMIPVNGMNINVLAYKGPAFISPETACVIPLRQYTHGAVASTPMVTILEIWYPDLR
ncbi:hypothetical protein [Sinomicrobium sp. M5D2P9]